MTAKAKLRPDSDQPTFGPGSMRGPSVHKCNLRRQQSRGAKRRRGKISAVLRIASAAVLCTCAPAQDNHPSQDALAAQRAISSRDEANFGQVLEDILRASKDRFRRVEGSRVENRRRDYYYEAKFYLPGATYCQILLERNGPIYNCEFEKAPAQSGFAALFDQLVSKIENALGTDWNRKTGTRKSGKEVLFTKAKEPAVQVIRETGAAVVHVFITPTATSPTGIGEHLPKRPPFVFP